jgi:hypothetical protein
MVLDLVQVVNLQRVNSHAQKLLEKRHQHGVSPRLCEGIEMC